jgi:hypothetical protein
MIPVFRSLQPALLARRLARPTTLHRHAITLPLTMPRIGDEELVAMAAFALPDRMHASHRLPLPHQRQPQARPAPSGSRGKNIHQAEEKLFLGKSWKKTHRRKRRLSNRQKKMNFIPPLTGSRSHSIRFRQIR